MTEPADSLNRDQIARKRPAVSERVEGGHPGAHQWRGLGGIQRLGHPGHRLDRRDHELLIATVVADAAEERVRAIDEIASSAGSARPVLTPMPADTDAFSLSPTVHRT